MKYKHLERQEMELTCISPIHIGSGEKLSQIDYVYDTKRQIAYFLDEQKWKQFLLEKGLLTKFITYISSNKSPVLSTWIAAVGLSMKNILPLSKHQCHGVTKETLFQKSGKKPNDIQRLITTVDGYPYIPGSSIKGALRSGLLFSWLTQHPQVCDRYWKEIQRDPDYNWRKYHHRLEDAFLQLQIKDAKNLVVKSCLRGLIVSDTVTTGTAKETILLQKIDASTKENRQHQKEHTLPLFRECIPAGTKLRFSITFDGALMAALGVHSIQDIIKASQAFTAYNLSMQKRVFGRDYSAEFKEAELADMLLGGGVGYQSKTVFYRVAPNEREGKCVLAAKLNGVFKAHRHRDFDTQIAPRTLKLTRTYSDRWIMGLCSLREV